MADGPFHHWRHVLQLQLHAVTTPATCNFMVMAIVLALCDADLAAQDTHLTAATGSLKRSIKYAGQLHLGEQFPHEQRVATLIAVQRGWANINPLPSKRQFTWYLLKIGKIPSKRNARVYVYNWGGCAMLCSAAISYDGTYTSSQRALTAIMTGNAACTCRILSVNV